MIPQLDTTAMDENRQPPSERTRQIAARLAQIRQQKAITQRAFCDALEVSQPMMSHYERGERRIPSDLLAEMAEILGVSADELLGLKVSRKNSQEMSDEMKKLWKKFQQLSKLPENDQRSIIRIINSVTKNKAPC